MPAGGAGRLATPGLKAGGPSQVWCAAWPRRAIPCPPTLTSSPPRPVGGPLRCAAQARSEAVSAAAEPGPGAWRAGREARGREKGRAGPGERPGARGPQRRRPPAGPRVRSARTQAPRLPPPQSCAWAGRAGPGVLVSVREERASGVRTQPPTGEGREDLTASFKMKLCLRFMAGWRPLPHPGGSSTPRGGRLGPLLLFALWRLWGRGLAVPSGRLALLGPARGAGVDAAGSRVLLRGRSDPRSVRGRLGSRCPSVPGWPLAVRSGFGTLWQRIPCSPPSHGRRKQTSVLALSSPASRLGRSLGCSYTPFAFLFQYNLGTRVI